MSDDWDRLALEAQIEIMAGALAIRKIRVRQDYCHWVTVGRALARLKTEAMRLAGSNTPYGRHYTTMYARLAAQVPDLDRKKLGNATTAHAVWLAENFVDINAWHSGLPTDQRRRINHPTTVRRRYDAAVRGKAPKPAATADIRHRVRHLHS